MTDSATPLVVAVSGGIDSVVLLHLLASNAERPLIVAHVNHGIRPDAGEDDVFVSELAAQYGVPFVSTQLKLGAMTSEETARDARYQWLETVRAEHGASAIATAHHEDDIFETILINLIRGTGWRGLCSLRQTETRVRPLLGLSKAWIVDYALTYELQWREDSTNESLRYLRNRIRHGVVPRLTVAARHQLRASYETQCRLRDDIAQEVQRVSEFAARDGEVSRHLLTMVEDSVAIELLRDWLGESLEQPRFRDLLLFAKVARPGARWSLDGTRFVVAQTRSLIVESPRD